MSSPPAQQAEWQFRDLQAADLDAIMAIELACYEFPWSRGNFADSIAEGYRCQGLFMAGQLLGYSIAMRGVDEAHLLNIAVAPACQGQKLAVVLLHQLCAWARLQPLDWLWLEVRLSNVRAQKLYRDYGMHTVGQRKNYYRTADGYEDALVMNCPLAPDF
jgi:ribosomal-protein-alanine N-acetyltransferase